MEKILLAGSTDIYGNADFALARYTKAGIPDSSFGNNGIVITDIMNFGDEAYAMALQSDGKIVAGGYAKDYSGHASFCLVRYNANGSIDSSFSNGGKMVRPLLGDDYIYAVAIQPNGKIVAAGHSNTEVGLLRCNADGSPDNSFGTNGLMHTDFTGDFSGFSEANGLILLPSGKIVVGGSIRYDFYSTVDFLLIRYNSNGTVDSSFASGGRAITDFNNTNDYVNAIALDNNANIVATGISFTTSKGDFALARFNSNGFPDIGFGNNGRVVTNFNFNTDDAANAIALQSDGKILIAGSVTNSARAKFAVLRYNAVAANKKCCTQVAEKLQLVVSPNPTTAVLHITGLNLKSSYIITVFDLYGNNVTSKVKGINNYELNVQQLAAGMYILKLQEKDKTYSLKFLKQ